MSIPAEKVRFALYNARDQLEFAVSREADETKKSDLGFIMAKMLVCAAQRGRNRRMTYVSGG